MSKRGRPAGGQNAFKSRCDSLLRVIQDQSTTPAHLFQAHEILMALEESSSFYQRAAQALKDSAAKDAENARLQSEVARLTADLAESEMAGNEALDTLERERSERTQ